MILEYRIVATGWGFIVLVGQGSKIKSLILPLPGPEMVQQALLRNGEDKLIENPTLLPRLAGQLTAYFAGHRVERWDCEPELTMMSEFTRRVLLVAARIPYGTVQTYGTLARDLGHPRGARAVGQALKRNPLPVIIPCHRVVAANGLGGFTAPGGLKTKEALLKLEGYSPANR